MIATRLITHTPLQRRRILARNRLELGRQRRGRAAAAAARRLLLLLLLLQLQLLLLLSQLLRSRVIERQRTHARKGELVRGRHGLDETLRQKIDRLADAQTREHRVVDFAQRNQWQVCDLCVCVAEIDRDR